MKRRRFDLPSVRVDRRELLRMAGLGLLGGSASGWFPLLANEVADHPDRRRHCVLLWMAGGPSQTDTFDMKPAHANGGEFKEIQTAAPGLRFSEHLPTLAQHADQMAVIRSLSTKEGDHDRGTYLMRTGQRPGGPVRYPCIGSSLSKSLGSHEAELPNYVSIVPNQAFNPAAFGPGFLGPGYAPTTVGISNSGQADEDGDPSQNAYARLGVDYLNLPPGVDRLQAQGRVELWRSLQDDFLARRQAGNVVAHDTAYRRAMSVMQSGAKEAFDLSCEPSKVRDAYGRGSFGQGCLMARRLIEQGVPFLEVALGTIEGNAVGWDTHINNFPAVRSLSEQLDAGWGALMSELKERGLLEVTTILWMGEFGRTPAINGNAGRDHHPQAWTCVMAGGGIQGGQAYGKTSDNGTEVEDGKVDVGDVLCTLCHALGVDPDTENMTDLGRPIRIAEGNPITDVLA
jgi:hypothetical protein